MVSNGGQFNRHTSNTTALLHRNLQVHWYFYKSDWRRSGVIPHHSTLTVWASEYFKYYTIFNKYLFESDLLDQNIKKLRLGWLQMLGSWYFKNTIPLSVTSSRCCLSLISPRISVRGAIELRNRAYTTLLASTRPTRQVASWFGGLVRCQVGSS